MAARATDRLTDLAVRRIKKQGTWADGRGLYIQVTKEGSKSWLFRFRRLPPQRGERWMGLGPYPDVSLAAARIAARRCRELRRQGIDPIERRRAEQAAARLEAAKAVTFRHCAESHIQAHKAAWRNGKHAAQWTSTLETYAHPTLGDLPVASIDTALVLQVLEPIWTAKPETATRVRQRIEAVLDWAAARGYRAGENPARWRGHLDKLLPKRSKVRRVRHHAAMCDSPLLTDLYQLNMMQAYETEGLTDTAVFEFFVRKLPAGRGFLMAAGLAQVVEFLENLRFLPEDIDFLRRSGRFSARFLDRLTALHFTGDVDAVPEGAVFFPDEPILRVIAPLPTAQLVETRILNLTHFQTLVASKAARMVLAAPGKQLVDFGLRRAHGAEAGLLAARASYLAGFAGTATTLAAPAFGVPIYGTMAHSFVQAHDSEEVAFLNFARARPDGPVLLIDTYDTERAAAKVVRVASRLRREGIRVRGVRLDSGDLVDHAVKVRRILDAGGLDDVTIFASGGIDEDQLMEMERRRAPIDGYGIGSSLVTSSDAPALDCAYKLQEYAGVARRKQSEGKATWPGRKQIWRQHEPDGTMIRDTLSIEGDGQPGNPLLRPAMRNGRRVSDLPDLEAARRHASQELTRLPASLRRLEPARYPVEVAPALRRLADACDDRIRVLSAAANS